MTSASPVPLSLEQRFVTLCAAVIGGCLAYVACDFGGWPRLTYDPHSRAWAFVDGVIAGAPMPYVGMLLWGAAGFLVSGAVVAVAMRWRGKRPSGGTLALAAAWSMTAFVGAALYFMWNLWPF